MSLGRCETQSSPAHAGRRSSCTETRDFNRRGRARPSIRQTRTPLRRSRQAALNHPSETERLRCRRQSATRANPTRRSLGSEAASTARATKHSAASDQFCIRARRVSLATGPKTNFHSERAAGREQRLRFCQRERAGDTADGARSSRCDRLELAASAERAPRLGSLRRCPIVPPLPDGSGSARIGPSYDPLSARSLARLVRNWTRLLVISAPICWRSADTATGIRSQPPRSEYGLIYLQIGWFAVRREPRMTGSEPPSIGVHCAATVARVPVIVAALFREGVTPEAGCLLYVRVHVKRGPGPAGAGRTVHCPATPSPFSHSHAGRAK